MAGPNKPHTSSLKSATDSCRLVSVIRTADEVSDTFDCVWQDANPSHEHLGSQEETDTLGNQSVTEGDSAPEESPSNPTAMAATVSGQLPKKASLLGIPQELRDIISEYVFTEVVQLSKRRQSPDKWQRSNLGLRQSCRQLYTETREMYYKSSVFKAGFSKDVVNFLRNGPKGDGAAWYLPLVKEIRLWDFTTYVGSGGKQKQLRRQREMFQALWCIELRPGVLRMSRKTFGGEIVWDLVESCGKDDSSADSSA
ncbi:hypothetical protein HII31_11173 [Pseudocercospora fuligena]|uniref:Uncharacterized protein n=1 Tax=Pseudocercospora fuligena TaxID=685502 RepID=A0A8H6RAU9_9PEZI|nr:hypothetical protein HII31_11173 [Pseudocercospora fuligena]